MTTKTRGTCPACFREMDVNDGLVGKHGWSEVGDRRVGEYDRAWHMGACFGSGLEPFEISPSGTWALLREVVYPSALATELRIQAPGDLKMSDLLRSLANTKRTGLELCAAAKGWKLGKLTEKKKKAPTIHAASFTGSTRCGSMSRKAVTGENVTCSRCLKIIASDAEARAAREAADVDAETLVAHLAENGQATAKDIKSALGWDAKRFNKAKDREWRGLDRVQEDFNRPVRYTAGEARRTR